MSCLAASTAAVEDLAIKRDQCMAQLAAAIRESTRALAVLDLVAFERCTTLQTKLCGDLAAVTSALASHSSIPASPDANRELMGALRTYQSLVRRSAHWVDASRKTLQLVTGFSEASSLGQGLRY
jgi:hypothetical protein